MGKQPAKHPFCMLRWVPPLPKMAPRGESIFLNSYPFLKIGYSRSRQRSASRPARLPEFLPEPWEKILFPRHNTGSGSRERFAKESADESRIIRTVEVACIFQDVGEERKRKICPRRSPGLL